MSKKSHYVGPERTVHHRAAVLMGWIRRSLDGKLVYIRPDAKTDAPNSYEIVDSAEFACRGSGLSDLHAVKKFLLKFSN